MAPEGPRGHSKDYPPKVGDREIDFEKLDRELNKLGHRVFTNDLRTAYVFLKSDVRAPRSNPNSDAAVRARTEFAEFVQNSLLPLFGGTLPEGIYADADNSTPAVGATKEVPASEPAKEVPVSEQAKNTPAEAMTEVRESSDTPALQDTREESVSKGSRRGKRGQGGSADTNTDGEVQPASHEGNANQSVPEIAETPKEKREALRTALSDVIQLPDRSAESLEQPKKSIHDTPEQSVAEAERADVAQKEAAYLTAYKELEQKRTLWNRLMKGKDLTEESEKVAALKTAYDEARVTYATALTRSAEERIAERGLDKVVDKKGVSLAERYNRLKHFTEVIRPAAEKKLQARQEALDARGRNAFTKALGWSAEANRKLEGKYGKNGARALRAAASAVLITGGAAALAIAGVTAPMGVAALAGYGTFKFGRSLFGAIAGAAAGETAGKVFETVWGRKSQAAAQEKLKNEGRGSNISLESLAEIDAAREKLGIKADEITLIKRKQLVQALTALGVGASAALTLAEFTAVQQAADASVTGGSTPDGKPTPGSLTSGEVKPPAGGAGVAESTKTPTDTLKGADAKLSVAASPEAPENMLKGAVVEKGEGFNKLIVDLKASVKSDFPGMIDSSPVMKELFSMSPSELSDKIGAFDPKTGESMVMQPGDQLFLDEKGNLWFEKSGGGKPQLLMEVDPKNPTQVITHELKGVEMHGAAEVAPKGSTEKPVAPSETQSAAAAASDTTEKPLSESSSAKSAEADPSSAPRSDGPGAADKAAPSTPSGELTIDSVTGTGTSASAEASQPLTIESVTQGAPATGAPSPSSGGLTIEDAIAQANKNPEAFINPQGVEIVPSAPHDYVWKVPGTDLTYTVAYGGSPEEIRAFAMREIAENPEARILVNTVVTDPSGGTMIRVDEWRLGDAGPVLKEGVTNPVTGKALPPISTTDFTRKLP